MAACDALFVLEAVVKAWAFGAHFYSRDGWCRFEGTMVLISLFSHSRLLDHFSTAGLPLPFLLRRAPKAALALRAFRLGQHLSGLKTLVTTIMLSLPSFANVGSLLLLVLFIYCILGVEVSPGRIPNRLPILRSPSAQHPFRLKP